MALSKTDLDELAKIITDSMKKAFQARNGMVFDEKGKRIEIDNIKSEEDYKKYKSRERIQKRNDKIDELKEEIERLKNSTSELSKVQKKMAESQIKSKEKELERLEKGGFSDEEVKKYRQEKYNKTINMINDIGKIVQGGVDIIVAVWTRDIEKQRALNEYNVKVAEVNIEKQTKIISNGMKSITAGFTKNAVDVAYDFVQSSYDISKTAFTSSAQLEIAQKNYSKATSAATKDMVQGIGTAVTAIGLGIAAFAGWTGVGAAVGTAAAVLGIAVNAVTSLWGMGIKQKELEIKQSEQAMDIGSKMMDTMKEIVQPWDQLAKTSTDFVLKMNDSGVKFARMIGYVGNEYADTMIDMTQATLVNGKTMAEIFGEEAEKLPQIMDMYIQSSSRAVNMSAEDYGNIMGTARLFGMSSEEASSLYGTMNIFNTSVSSASDSMGVMYHQMTKMGLSTKKFGKDLVENLKLAQKYNFKGGVDNMMKLTKWSQQTRFNLSNAASFADKLQSGGLSEGIEASARLQVLGGNAAMYSDPLGMMFDAWNDAGSLAERMNKMFGDITGTFNKRTGETEFTGYENMMIAERAKALGMDFGEVKNMIREQDRQKRVGRVLSGLNLDKDTQTAIANRATYNTKNGKWEVTDIYGNKHGVEDVAKLSQDELEKIMLPADTQESILSVSQRSLSVQEDINNNVVRVMSKLGVEKKQDVYDTAKEKSKYLYETLDENWSEILKMWKYANDYSLDSFKANIENMKAIAKNPEAVKEIYDGFLKNITQLGKDVSNEGGVLRTAISKMAASMEDYIDYINELITGKKSEKKINKEYQDKNSTAEQDAYAWELYTNGYTSKAKAVQKAVDVEQKPKYNSSEHWHFDGVGNTNGGMIIGASNVKSINDGGVNVRTASNDQYLAAMPNGPIDKILQQLIPGLQALINNTSSQSSGNVNLNVKGKIDLEQEGSSINLVDIIKNNPSVSTQIVSLLKRTIEANASGKPIKNYM